MNNLQKTNLHVNESVTFYNLILAKPIFKLIFSPELVIKQEASLYKPFLNMFKLTSSRGETFDYHKKASLAVFQHYLSDKYTRSKARRVSSCADELYFELAPDANGKRRLRLKHAVFCRVRLCPVCQWRRTLTYIAKFHQNLPTILAKHQDLKGYVFLFLTLTVKNCDISQLKTTINNMNSAFVKMKKRKEFINYIQGYIKAIEVTKSNSSAGNSHPHFHVLLAVKEQDYKRSDKRLTTKDWQQLWKSCLNVDYDPVVNIKKTYSTKKDFPKGNVINNSGILEVLKYSVKVPDLVSDRNWFLTLSYQLDRKRFIDVGGIFKHIFSEKEKKKGGEKKEKEVEMKGAVLRFEYDKKYDKYAKANMKK